MTMISTIQALEESNYAPAELKQVYLTLGEALGKVYSIEPSYNKGIHYVVLS